MPYTSRSGIKKENTSKNLQEEIIRLKNKLKNNEAKLEKSESLIKKSDSKLNIMFDNNLMSLWTEDYSHIFNILANIRKLNKKSYIDYLTKNPDIVKECSRKIEVINLNKETVKMFRAESKEHLLKNVRKIYTEKSYNFFIQELA